MTTNTTDHSSSRPTTVIATICHHDGFHHRCLSNDENNDMSLFAADTCGWLCVCVCVSRSTSSVVPKMKAKTKQNSRRADCATLLLCCSCALVTMLLSMSMLATSKRDCSLHTDHSPAARCTFAWFGFGAPRRNTYQSQVGNAPKLF
mmetsp:Transcript_47532/g.115813  ORF Transcript_47532/g.115813 Transcript_47532/m.115813 type:complete len:147 (+) Transcript_47532:196-636(+)